MRSPVKATPTPAPTPRARRVTPQFSRHLRRRGGGIAHARRFAGVGVGRCAARRAARAFTPLGSTSTLALADDAVEFWSGLLAGAVQKTAKELVLHPLDTAKTRLQLGGSRRALVGGGLFDDAYSGIGPALLSGAPAASLFFAVKDGIKSRAKGLGKVGATLAAVAGANVCYWVLRNPTEVVKARRQAGIDGDAAAAAAALWARSGPAGFYVGYLGNLAYAYPVDASKFLLYEAYKRDAKRRSGGAPLPALNAAVAGALSAAAAQSVATPLDVARTRIMTGGAAPDANAVPLVAEIFRDEGDRRALRRHRAEGGARAALRRHPVLDVRGDEAVGEGRAGGARVGTFDQTTGFLLFSTG